MNSLHDDTDRLVGAHGLAQLFPLRRTVIVRTHDVFDRFADQLIANAAMSFRQGQVGEHDPPFAIGDEHLLLGGVERTQQQTPVGREHIRHDESRICRIQHQYSPKNAQLNRFAVIHG